MSTEIYNQNHGRSISSYELLEETRETYGLSRQDAHDAIHAMLSGIIEADGEETVILDRTPVRPELLTSNPQDVDIDQWITVSDETANHIRGALAATFEPATKD